MNLFKTGLRCAAVTAFTVAGTLTLTTVADAAETYEVRSGDTLSEIAQDFDTSWRKLFEWNRDKISSPDLIYPGQVFVVSSDGKGSSKPTKAKPQSSETVRPATGSITSPYGMRTHPITGVYKLHDGTDFSYGDGNAYAARAGEVSVKYPGWAGNLVVINHGGGVITQYAHLSSVSVSSGEHVNAGEVIGRIGSLGMATGPHLHFMVLIDGELTNPMSWLD
jgi:murein DD-endopeptidase MepM/ murein hydrolase activator NlpD